jgi:TusA-related sulfurtransferase
METTGQAVAATSDEEVVCGAFVDALADRSPKRLQACFHPDVELRALVPPGLQESVGFAEVLARLESWFGAPDSIQLLKKEVYRVSDRLHVRYRFGEHYSDGDSEIIEQDAYCEVRDGRIVAIDILCSGHRPASAADAGAVHHYDAGTLGCGSGLPQEFRRQIGAVPVGSILEVVARDPAAKEDLPSLARLLGHQVLSVKTSPDGATVVAVRRGR